MLLTYVPISEGRVTECLDTECLVRECLETECLVYECLETEGLDYWMPRYWMPNYKYYVWMARFMKNYMTLKKII